MCIHSLFLAIADRLQMKNNLKSNQISGHTDNLGLEEKGAVEP